jgi:beta-phosphoglucomutase-like phosphatase (HAD superfamily)
MQKPVVKAILFDLDGTLVDTIEESAVPWRMHLPARASLLLPQI